MSTVFELTMSAFASILDAIGVDLEVLTVAIMVAFAIHISNAGLQNRMGKPSKYAQYDTSTEDCAKPQRVNRGERHLKPRGVVMACPEHVADTAERIEALVGHRPTLQSSQQGLELYAGLRVTLGLDRREEAHHRSCGNLVEAMRHTKHTAMTFYFKLMQCAIRCEQYHLVDRLILDMEALGIPRNSNFYECAMKQLARHKQYQLALNLYDRLSADGVYASPVTWSCLLGFAAEVGDHDLALRFFEFLSARTTPSIRSYMTVLRVHAKRQDWKAAVATLGDMKRRSVPVDNLILNIVLAIGVAADDVDEVETLLAEAEAADPPISNDTSYNTMIKVYARRGDAQSAFRTKDRMEARGWKPNAITFNTLMDATVRGSKPSQAWEVLTLMNEGGYQPDKYTFSILVKSLSEHPASDRIEAYSALLQEFGANFDASVKATYYHSLFQIVAQMPDDALLIRIVQQMRQQRVVLNDAETKRLLKRAPSRPGLQ